MRFADYDVQAPVISSFRLDGGAMFGSVPKVLWERREPADPENRIGLVARVLFLEGGGRRILLDAGMGTKLDPRDAGFFAVSTTPDESLPFRWEELTDLVLTHLHFDHAGGITRFGPAAGPGETQRPVLLSAPRAMHWLQKANHERALAPGPRERASYVRDNVEPLRDAQLQLVEGELEILPGIRVHPSNGHTRGLQWVTIGEGKNTLAFPADLIPTSSHIHLPFVMGYDMCVDTLLEEKDAFLRQAVEQGWIVVFEHDRQVPAARLTRGKDGKFSIAERVDLA
jgi:glyoxylase-like metal-dependent hydrolase (beta-lactamase superfamily II)